MDFVKRPKRSDGDKPKKVRRVKAKAIKSPSESILSPVEDSSQLVVSESNPESQLQPLNDLAERLRVGELSKTVDRAEQALSSHTKVHIFSKLANLRGVRNFVLVWMFLMISLLGSVILNQVFGQASYQEVSFVDGGAYVEGVTGNIDSLNPIFASSRAEHIFSRLAFTRLYTMDSTGNVKGQLATRSTTKDNKRYAIDLRSDAVWSDGEALNADDVIFTTNLLKNPESGLSQYSTWRNIEVEKISDQLVVFDLPRETSDFEQALVFPILPEHKLKDTPADLLRENNFSRQPITSGMFKFRMIQQINGGKAVIHLESNDDYFEGQPKLDRFEIRTYAGSDDLKQALLAGEISASAEIAVDDLSDQDRHRFEYISSSVNRGIFSFINQNDPILKDPVVRKAISRGVDLNSIRQSLGENYKALDLPILGEFLDDNYVPNLPEFNVESAKKILDEAGWKMPESGDVRKKDDLLLAASLVVINRPDLEKVAEGLASQLRAIGFEVDLQVVDPADSAINFGQNILQPRQYGILIYEIDLGSSSPDILTFWHSSQANAGGFNLSNYKDFISDDVLSSTLMMPDNELRVAKYESFIRRWLADVPAIAIAQSQSTYTYRPSVKTFDTNRRLVNELDRYGDALYWQAARGSVYKTP